MSWTEEQLEESEEMGGEKEGVGKEVSSTVVICCCCRHETVLGTPLQTTETNLHLEIQSEVRRSLAPLERQLEVTVGEVPDESVNVGQGRRLDHLGDGEGAGVGGRDGGEF